VVLWDQEVRGFGIRARTGGAKTYILHYRARTGRGAPLRKLTIGKHDLRHSFASMGVAGGLSLPIIGALLGHKHPATTGRYAHLAADPLRTANDLVGMRIEAAMNRTSDFVD
jgi:integrase